jgi:hypothetical protein
MAWDVRGCCLLLHCASKTIYRTHLLTGGAAVNNRLGGARRAQVQLASSLNARFS